MRDFSARNVIYTDGTENIPENLAWRTDRLNVDLYDFEYLREWRIKGDVFDFSEFPKEDIIVIAPTMDSLNSVVVKFDMEFVPYVNYYTGDIIENWEESFTREWKGISVDTLGKLYLDDYAISCGTLLQVLGEDMLEKIFASWPINTIQKIK